MKRICFAWMVAAGVLSTSAARADFGGPVAPQMPTANPYHQAPPKPSAGEKERYGLLPAIQEVVFWKKAQTPIPPANVPYPYPPYMATGGNPYAPTMGQCAPQMMGSMPGTLVFPQHQYIRSPRDFFMWQPNR